MFSLRDQNTGFIAKMSCQTLRMEMKYPSLLLEMVLYPVQSMVDPRNTSSTLMSLCPQDPLLTSLELLRKSRSLESNHQFRRKNSSTAPLATLARPQSVLSATSLMWTVSSTPVAICACVSNAPSNSGPMLENVHYAEPVSEMSSGLTELE